MEWLLYLFEDWAWYDYAGWMIIICLVYLMQLRLNYLLWIQSSEHHRVEINRLKQERMVKQERKEKVRQVKRELRQWLKDNDREG